MKWDSGWILILVWIFYSSCRDSDEVNNKSVFRYNESSAISSLDPAFANDLESMWVVNQLFDGLVAMDDSLRVIPVLAKNWTISDDGLCYEFILRSDVFFHDRPGQVPSRKLVASDVVFSFNRIIDPLIASPGSWIFQNLAVNGLQAINDSIVQIHLNEPQGSFLAMLTTQFANIVSPEAVQLLGNDFRKSPIGTGPFQFAFWEDQIGIVFHKNNHYWMKDDRGQALPYLDAIQIDLVKDPFAEFQGLISGKYDFMSGVHPSFMNELLDKEGQLQDQWNDRWQLMKMPFIKTDYLGCYLGNSEGSLVGELNYRKALSMSIPREELCSKLRNQLIVPAAQGFVPPILDGDHQVENVLTYQPQLAKQLVDALKQQWGDPLPTVELATTPEFVDIYEFLQFKWQEVGIPIQIKVMQSAAFKDATAKGQIALFRKNWLADFPDAENFLQVFTKEQWSPKGPNYTHYENKNWEEKFYRCKRSSDEKERRNHFQELDHMITEDLPVIPLYYDQVIHVVNRNIENWHLNGINLLDLTHVKKVVVH